VEISPPSSPEMHAKDALPSNSVPVDNMPPTAPPHALRPASRQESNIPILRREKRRNQAAAAASNLVAGKDPGQPTAGLTKVSDTRWDSFSGERTSSAQGRSASVKPGEFTPVVTNLEGTYGPSSAPKVQSSFGDRVRKLKENNKMGGNRPEWKGSSGRVAIVPAPEDDPYVPPLQIPRKSSKRVPSIPSMGSSRVSTPANETPVVSPSAHGGAQYFNAAPISTSRQPSSPAAYDDSLPASPLDSLPSQRNRPVVASPSPTTLPNSVSAIERNFHEALRDVSISSPTGSQRPPEVSRFSATTYATSANTSSPRASIDSAPPMPSPGLAAKYASQNRAVSPILNRRRPVGASSYTFDRTTAALRQPPLSGDPKFIGMHRSTLSKALPKSPEEGKAIDKVTALQAQLGDLARQKSNIEASIRRMTELMPGEMTGFALGMSSEGRRRELIRRGEEKRKVEALRDDLADVKREEHDVGLKLHRALKKADERAVYEPTGLWVRRVTG